jgi:hypothetical protein
MSSSRELAAGAVGVSRSTTILESTAETVVSLNSAGAEADRVLRWDATCDGLGVMGHDFSFEKEVNDVPLLGTEGLQPALPNSPLSADGDRGLGLDAADYTL